jgi:uncharacterized membrane protein
VPTIVGWKVHEWLWRGGYEAVGARADEVAKIYQLSDMEEVREIIKKYNVGWIVVGENERINYQVNDVFLLMLGEKVFEYGETYILQVR